MKLVYSFIKEEFEVVNYVLLSETYKNNRTKLDVLCPLGHKYATTYSNFKRGRRCPICKHIKIGNLKRTNFEEVKKAFEAENYILLSTTYINFDQKLAFICPNGHKHSMNLHNWKAGWRCIKCRDLRQSERITGEKHPRWQGGISLQGYCQIWRDTTYKESIKSRDSNICQNPYCYKTDSVLHIHHIDYDKKNCHPSNLITVCRSCNARANIDREWHKDWYKTIIKNRNI
ncbi:HNH endonuclease [bacterium]|nr:HNH endonuclease [bacterium]